MDALEILADFRKEARAPLGFSICFFLYGLRVVSEIVWSLFPICQKSLVQLTVNIPCVQRPLHLSPFGKGVLESGKISIIYKMCSNLMQYIWGIFFINMAYHAP